MKNVIGALLLALLTMNVSAQFIEIDDVKASRFTGVETITSGDDGEIEGYCVYYSVDKGEKGQRIFEFAIMNKELSKVTKTQISIHKYAEINNTVFNGKFLLVSVDDTKNKQTLLYIINDKGEVVKEKSIAVDKKRLASSVVYPDNTGEGFYVIAPIDDKKLSGYSIAKVSNDLESLWKIDKVKKNGEFIVEDLISAKDRFITWETEMIGSKVKPSVICYDAKTGDEIFSRSAYDGTSTMLYNELRIDDDNNVYAGGSYVKGEKVKSVNNDGIYIVKLDSDGKEVLYNKVSNKEKIQKVLKATSSSFSLGSKDKVLVEDLIVQGDEIIVVSEMFRKNTNMTPAMVQQTRDLITGKYVGNFNQSNGSASPKVVMDIKDFIFFKFDQKGDLKEIKPGMKDDNTKITCWYPYYGYSGLTLARELKKVGWFDYAFQTINDEGNMMIVCKDNASGTNPRIYTFDVTNGYIQKDLHLKQQAKLDLDKGKVGYFNALKNDDGKMVLVYYQRKLDKITLSLEAIQ